MARVPVVFDLSANLDPLVKSLELLAPAMQAGAISTTALRDAVQKAWDAQGRLAQLEFQPQRDFQAQVEGTWDPPYAPTRATTGQTYGEATRSEVSSLLTGTNVVVRDRRRVRADADTPGPRAIALAGLRP